MIHARQDYNRMQDPALADPSLLGKGSTPIGEDEPVVLFRAQDKHFIGVLEDFKVRVATDAVQNMMYEEKEKANAIIRQVIEHQARAEEWQRIHGCKAPDLPE